MYPYSLREEPEPRKEIFEIVVAAVTVAILVACALSDLSVLSQMTPGSATHAREQTRQSLAQVQTRNEALTAELTKVSQRLESTRSDLTKLTEAYNKLGTLATATTTRLNQLETMVQQANERMAKINESAAVQQIAKQRDEAIVRSKQSDDQVRQLTLRLQKAGIYQ
ncbi:MAG: hypothetical protein MUC88_24925 [Planctomycetes bacterium]|jgi:septal ring factor EnvC (AmiA/AmiB activator)|nr:hypothetical protein [Planctomycetota bacterium]